MAKKGKNRYPNAPPEQQTILLESPIGQQPPHNPYYPDISQHIAPPPYSDLSTSTATTVPYQATTRMTNGNIMNNNNPRYERFANAPGGPQQAPTVVVQRVASSGRDFIYSRYTEKVRNYNRSMALISVFSIALSCLVLYFFSLRPCFDDFVIHQLGPEKIVTVRNLKVMPFNIIFISLVVLVISILKSCIGYGKNSSCFLFLMGLVSLYAMLGAGYMAYLSFYTPCVASLNELFTNTAKTLITKGLSMFDMDVAGPQKGYFNEKNVFDYAKEDLLGIYTFLINAMICLFYFAGFLDALLAC